jgi:hypothetical protein
MPHGQYGRDKASSEQAATAGYVASLCTLLLPYIDVDSRKFDLLRSFTFSTAAAQIPRSREHVLAGGRGEDGLDAGQKGNSSCGVRSSLRGDDHDRVALMKLGDLQHRCPLQELREIAVTRSSARP